MYICGNSPKIETSNPTEIEILYFSIFLEGLLCTL